MRAKLVVSSLLLVLTASTSVAAEAPRVTESASSGVGGVAPERRGLYFGLGVGAGAANLTESGLGPKAGTVATRLGLALWSQLLVGVQVAGLLQYNDWAAGQMAGATVSSVLTEVTYFPLARLPLSVGAGAGWGSALRVRRMADNNKGDTRAMAQSDNGVSWMGAVGWDFFPGEGANLGLQDRYDGVYLPDIKTAQVIGLGLWLNFY